MLAGACQPAPPAAPSGPNPTRTIVFKGLGAWWDVYDWSPTFTRNRQRFSVADVDRLARDGVQTLYIQTATYHHPADLLDPSLLRSILNRARSHGIRVVGWYLPAFTDYADDMASLEAIAEFGFDGLGLDIESTANPDVAHRSDMVVFESAVLRNKYPNLPMAAIPVTPVIWEHLNRGWWANFPYRRLAPLFDAWMPMAYWSFRQCSHTEWYDPYRYTRESVEMLRRLTGNPNLPVHPIGGQASPVASDSCKPPPLTTTDLFWMNAAMVDSGAIGGSIYDDATTSPDLYGALQMFRRELVK